MGIRRMEVLIFLCSALDDAMIGLYRRGNSKEFFNHSFFDRPFVPFPYENISLP